MTLQKDLQKFKTEFTLAILSVLEGRLLQEILDGIASDITRRTRRGKGAYNGRETDLLPLSDAYIDDREADDYGLLSDRTKPTKSNLTYTGQMLDSLKATVFKGGKGEIKATGRRKVTPKEPKPSTNAEVATWVTEKGRPFLDLTDREKKRLEREIEKNLTRKLRSV